jgi:peptidyl-prolyl cis-trans isomerase SurA
MQNVAENCKPAGRPVTGMTTLLRISAALVFGAMLVAAGSLARAQANEPASPYGGTVAEGIIARVNDQIVTKSDYDRALADMDQVGRQHQETMQEISAAHKDLLRDLIDQQLWLSKGKELNVTGETELVKKLDEIRKQYNLETIDDLEKAAREQGVSFEDFKANIRNQIVTQEVMRQQVGEHIQMTPGEVERYYEAHMADYAQPESERLSEILISTGGGDDPAKVTAAKAKADDIEARLHSGGDFAQLARSFSDGPTASEGGDLGQYKRGQLGKLLEDQTFNLNSGQYTDPILTRQGYIILKVVQHTPGGPRPFKDVTQDVEEAYYMSRMEPAIRDYLSKMRDEDFIWIKGRIYGFRRHLRRAASQHCLQRLRAARAEEEGQGRADTVPREHAHLPAEIGGGAGRG